MLFSVVLVRTDVSEEHIASIIRVTNRRARNVSSNSQPNHAADSCHPDDGRDSFVRNVGSDMSHAA
jgi:hypothetical protein